MEENTNGRFRQELREKSFSSYAEYMDYVFACVNMRMTDYIQGLMGKYAAGQGQFKNVMYPDIEIAYNLCNDSVLNFLVLQMMQKLKQKNCWLRRHLA